VLFFTIGWAPVNYSLASKRAETAVMQFTHQLAIQVQFCALYVSKAFDWLCIKPNGQNYL